MYFDLLVGFPSELRVESCKEDTTLLSGNKSGMTSLLIHLFKSTKGMLKDHLDLYPVIKSFKSSGGKEIKRISGLYSKDDWNLDKEDGIWMEHSALNDPSNKWEFYVGYRQRGHSALAKQWRSVTEYYRDATVKINHNIIELTIPSPNENHEFAVFGKPEIEDKKRMQVGLFGKKPTKGNNILVHVVLFDDTLMAFENVCEKEESKDRQLLTTLAGLFISNSDKDIMIEVNGLEPGYEINGSTVKTIKSKDAWRTPENSTDYPNCLFEISCKDKRTSSFKCEIIACQETDTAEAEVVTHFGQNYEATATENGVTEQPQKELEKLIGICFFQVSFFLACCFTDSDQSNYWCKVAHVLGAVPHLPADDCIPTGHQGIDCNVYKTAKRGKQTRHRGMDREYCLERPESARDRLGCL
ncbi:uncharacterized protein LOC111325831 [Stylophora pistillata]|uniref:uncharacterized protein LOC111325831 n=1 Tax=Stylophora pistillata TaxID=50429 RepID=UPI000C03DDD0|nr:uncharacterized protein LOC111325831 [Stylophora pistillata]